MAENGNVTSIDVSANIIRKVGSLIASSMGKILSQLRPHFSQDSRTMSPGYQSSQIPP
jgi:hypothetical protein